MEVRFKTYIFLIFVKLSVIRCIPIDEFYPFGISSGDARIEANDDGSSTVVKISSLFPFFNNQQNSLYVNTNGAISFLQALSSFTPEPFPLANRRLIIAAFWADIDTRNGGTVYYRETTNRAVLDRASNEVRKYFPSQTKFQAAWVFIATWDNVAFFGANGVGKRKRNTFQAILITNGRHSFTIMNYNKIQWTTGTASEGSSTTGLGGTPAQVGFNAGDGVNYFVVNASRTADIINVPTMTNVDHPGKFAFRIDSEKIEKGGCNTEGTLTITPRSGTMLGGQKLVMSGPCLVESDRIFIQYKIIEKEYECERTGEFSMTCITPLFYDTGDTRVFVYVFHEDGSRSDYTGLYTIVNIANTKPGLIRKNPHNWKSGQNVEIVWKKDQIPFNDDYAKCDIFYIIQKRNKEDIQLLHGGPINTNLSVGDEQFSFPFRTQVHVALLRLASANVADIWHTESVWSDIFVVDPENTDISRTLCSVWYDHDIDLQPVPGDSKQPCPCTLRQALLDTGRFHRDPMCNSFIKKSDDLYNSNCINYGDTQHCIQLNSVGFQGTGELCCYDKTGNLLDSRKALGAGAITRYHYFGTHGNIPYLSNFYFDTVPYLQCCLYNSKEVKQADGSKARVKRETSENTCNKFLERRPASDCKGYRPPRIARASGDPHMKTLDGLSYTFNGIGEYHLLKHLNSDFDAQVRMERVIDDNGKKKDASVFTSFVGSTVNVSDVVEIQLNSIRVADALLNGEIIDFSETPWVDFKGGSILLLQDEEERNDSLEILVMFTEPRISFQVKASKRLLNVITVVSDDSLKGSVEGLLGNYDGDPENDLRNNSGDKLPSNSSLREIHFKFGESWRISSNTSLFTYPIGKSFDDFANTKFEPNFVVPVLTYDNKSSICGSSIECLYDLQTTGLDEIAVATKELSETFEYLEESAEPIISCGLPPDVSNGEWDTTGYTAGSFAILSCYEGFVPNFASKAMCGQNGEWIIKDGKCSTTINSATVATLYGSLYSMILLVVALVKEF